MTALLTQFRSANLNDLLWSAGGAVAAYQLLGRAPLVGDMAPGAPQLLMSLPQNVAVAAAGSVGCLTGSAVMDYLSMALPTTATDALTAVGAANVGAAVGGAATVYLMGLAGVPFLTVGYSGGDQLIGAGLVVAGGCILSHLARKAWMGDAVTPPADATA